MGQGAHGRVLGAVGRLARVHGPRCGAMAVVGRASLGPGRRRDPDGGGVLRRVPHILGKPLRCNGDGPVFSWVFDLALHGSLPGQMVCTAQDTPWEYVPAISRDREGRMSATTKSDGRWMLRRSRDPRTIHVKFRLSGNLRYP